eukprot:Rmarinus@m.26838
MVQTYNLEVELPMCPEQYWDLKKDETFRLFQEQLLGMRKEIVETWEDDQAYYKRVCSTPDITIPDMVKRALKSDKLKYYEIQSANKVVPPYLNTFKIISPVLADRVFLYGTLLLEPIPGRNASKQILFGTVNIDVMGGSFVEKLIVSNVTKSYMSSPDVVVAWKRYVISGFTQLDFPDLSLSANPGNSPTPSPLASPRARALSCSGVPSPSLGSSSPKPSLRGARSASVSLPRSEQGVIGDLELEQHSGTITEGASEHESDGENSGSNATDKSGKGDDLFGRIQTKAKPPAIREITSGGILEGLWSSPKREASNAASGEESSSCTPEILKIKHARFSTGSADDEADSPVSHSPIRTRRPSVRRRRSTPIARDTPTQAERAPLSSSEGMPSVLSSHPSTINSDEIAGYDSAGSSVWDSEEECWLHGAVSDFSDSGDDPGRPS